MKITIEPSYPEPHYVAVTFDTLKNDDSTADIVDAAARVIIALGHCPPNVAESLIETGEALKQEAVDLAAMTKE